ncbi:MAG: hypothetical protein LBD52_00725 [Prevotellaceae bacterium]|nr:hypothetical protein [Prevotellaceae bacterium]
MRRFAPTAYCYGLLLLLFCPLALAAQSNGVTVSGLNVDAGTVTFNVSWNKTTMPVSLWSDSVWVFVDYNNAGKMERLPLLPGATLTATSTPGVGRVEYAANNVQGVWVVGNARSNGSFSATVQLLAATATVVGACAYASNYPPVGEYTTSSQLSFTGTPMYDIVIEDAGGKTDTRESGRVFTIPPDYTLKSFTDRTGAPGIIKCMPMSGGINFKWAPPEVSKGQPATYTLLASTSGFCAGNAAGAGFSLSGTEYGRKYQLYRDGTSVGAALSGTGSAATFSELFNVGGLYTARSVQEGAYCEVAMTGSHAITSNPLPQAPLISAGDVCLNGGDLVFTVTQYSGSLTWVSVEDGMVNELSVTFGSSSVGTKTVKVQTSQTYTNAPTCFSAEATQSATVNALPSITAQPQSRVFCDVTGDITLTVTAQPGSGSTLSYQWWKTGTDAGTNVGTNSATYSTTADYWVVISG